jgi:hypothetical protein
MIHIGDDWTCDVLGAVNASAQAVWISRSRPVPDETVLRRAALVADTSPPLRFSLPSRHSREDEDS